MQRGGKSLRHPLRRLHKLRTPLEEKLRASNLRIWQNTTLPSTTAQETSKSRSTNAEIRLARKSFPRPSWRCSSPSYSHSEGHREGHGPDLMNAGLAKQGSSSSRVRLPVGSDNQGNVNAMMNFSSKPCAAIILVELVLQLHKHGCAMAPNHIPSREFNTWADACADRGPDPGLCPTRLISPRLHPKFGGGCVPLTRGWIFIPA